MRSTLCIVSLIWFIRLTKGLVVPPNNGKTIWIPLLENNNVQQKVDLLNWQQNDNDDDELIKNNLCFNKRGGSSSSVKEINQKFWSNVGNSWKQTLKSIRKGIMKPFRRRSNKNTKRQEELLKQLTTTPVRKVTAPNSTLLSQQILQACAARADVLGKPLRASAVQDLARALKKWYERNGYVLHTVTGATLQVDTQTAELSVQEPLSNRRPVEIIYLKEMVIHPDDGTLLTLRQFRRQQQQQRRQSLLTRADVNTTYIPTDLGRTKANRVAHTLGLRGGKPFRWDPIKWDTIRTSGVFSSILRCEPKALPDGTVQLQIFAQESPPRNLEYGISRSLYTGTWEGEADFQHKNVMGGGETLGISFKRGTHDAEPSIKIQFTDDKFRLEGGYDVQIFTDYIGEHLEEQEEGGAKDYDHDELLDRKGLSFLLRNPIDTSKIRHSTLRACLERTTTKGGRHESIASTTLGLGPFTEYLPLEARSNILGSVSIGSRLAAGKEEEEKEESSSSSSSPFLILPFSSMTVTTRQLFPLAEIGNRPVHLALQHSVSSSTRNLPRHEANALGVSTKIRGYTTSGRVKTAVVGTTELRIPLAIPSSIPILGGNDASLIFFGDWSYSQRGESASYDRKTCVGVGLRKSIQGLPLKYDLCWNGDGKIGAFFGLGRDFNV